MRWIRKCESGKLKNFKFISTAELVEIVCSFPVRRLKFIEETYEVLDKLANGDHFIHGWFPWADGLFLGSRHRVSTGQYVEGFRDDCRVLCGFSSPLSAAQIFKILLLGERHWKRRIGRKKTFRPWCVTTCLYCPCPVQFSTLLHNCFVAFFSKNLELISDHQARLGKRLWSM
jgi:hypothetical protein